MLVFNGKKHLTTWLQQTDEGRGILAEIQGDHPREWLETTTPGQAMVRACAERYVPREAVLIVCGKDRRTWIEVYARREISFHFADILITDHRVDAERLMEMRLPHRYKELYYPVNLRATHVPQPMTPREAVDGYFDLRCLLAVQEAVERNEA